MPILAFFLLLICFLMAGYGVLRLFRLRLAKAYTITLSLLLGIALASFLPFLLQLLYIPITGASVFGSLALATALLTIPTVIHIRKEGFSAFLRTLRPGPFRARAYEIPFWVVLGFLIFVSIWRCYYLPPTSRDMLSGPEAIAEYAVREHTLINSFFNIDLQTTNNQFKSPFLISLQVIYKLAGFPFGQVWLSIVFISLTVFLYHALREKLHPLLAATLLLVFTMAPEPYAYTFMILYDYSNMVFFFLGLYFLFQALSAPRSPALANPDPSLPRSPAPAKPEPFPPRPATFYFAGLLLGIATYIRSETLALLVLFLPLILLAQRRAGTSVTTMLVSNGLFFLPSLVGYYLPVQLYIHHYLPVHYAVGDLINMHPGDLSPLFRRYADIFKYLLTGKLAIHLWGYFFYLTAILFVAEAVFVRRFTREARNWLYVIVAVYLGLGILGWLLPLMDLADSTKRGLFKILPAALFYLANNQLLLRFSKGISRWELEGVVSSDRRSATRTPAPVRSVLTKTGKTAVAQRATRSRGSASRIGSSSRPAAPKGSASSPPSKGPASTPRDKPRGPRKKK